MVETKAEFDRHLIFDFGLHEGWDSRFYLDKGFRDEKLAGLDWL